MTLDDTLSEIEKQWPLELKEAQPASDTKRPMEPFLADATALFLATHGTKPFLIRRDDAGFACAITRSGYDVLHLNSGMCRNETTILAIVDKLNSAPSVPERPKSEAAAGVSSPKDSLSPEIVL